MNKTQLAKAFVAGNTGKCHNAHTDGNTYYLHGHPIVQKIGSEYKFNWCGWYTQTTASHMNFVLRTLNAGVHVSAARHRDEGIDTFTVTN